MSHAHYYNDFYLELSKLDEKGNNFSKIFDMLPLLSPTTTVIDIGCGHGGVCEKFISEYKLNVTGMEINEECLDSLKKKGYRAINHDITSAFNLEEKFDIVCLLDVLEHVFDPLSLLREAKKVCRDGGYILITVPLYFDLADRLRILFTGSIISYDNRCYGDELYNSFRSYNYDHIRFFRHSDLYEMAEKLGLTVDYVKYNPMAGGRHFIVKLIRKLIANRFTANQWPSLFAHQMKLRLKNKVDPNFEAVD